MEATQILSGRHRETRRLREREKKRGGRGGGKRGWRRGRTWVIFDVFLKRTCLQPPLKVTPYGMWDLCSLTGNQTPDPCSGGRVLTTGPPEKYSSVGKESACNAGDPGLIPGSGRSPGEVIGYPLQYSWASLVDQLVKNLPAIQET